MVKTTLTVVLLVLCQYFGEGFDFTLDPHVSDSSVDSTGRHVCAVLRCTEAVPDDSTDHVNRSRTLTGFTVSRNRPDENVGLGSSSARWQELASVTPQQPSLNRVSDGVKVTGQLSGKQASLSLEFTKTNDCLESQFSCVAVFVDDQGRTSVKKSLVGKAVVPSKSSPHNLKIPGTSSIGPTAGDQGSLPGNLMQLASSIQMKIDWIGYRLEDSLKALENRLEDKVGEVRAVVNDRTGGLDNSMEGRFGALGTRMDNLENMLEDRMTQLHNRMLQNSRQVETSCPDNVGVCDQLASKLDNLGDKLKLCVAEVKKQNESTGKALDQLGAAIDQFAGTEETKLTDLVSSVANLSGQTQDLVSRVSSFRDGYRSGALVPVDEFFDPLGTGKKEWRLAFRGTAYNNVRVYPAYMYGTGIPLEVERGCKQFNRSIPCVNHYRNTDALDNWAGVDEVLFAIYKDGQMVKRVVFNGKDSTFTSWFAAGRVILSSWTDLTTQPHNFFSIEGADHGDLDIFRRFFMSLDYDRNCDGFRGWFKATENAKGCPVEIKTLAIPMFQYAPGDTFALWSSTVALADAFGIFLKYE